MLKTAANAKGVYEGAAKQLDVQLGKLIEVKSVSKAIYTSYGESGYLAWAVSSKGLVNPPDLAQVVMQR